METKQVKKSGAAAPGKKKVIRRLVKNAKTGEIIKTEIVRIDSSGERTVTSYPAGTPVPSLSSLQNPGSSQMKKSTSAKKATQDDSKTHPPDAPARSRSRDEDMRAYPGSPGRSRSPKHSETKKLPRAYDEINNSKERADVGPSVPANVPGLEDLIRKEEELRRATESGLDSHEKAKAPQEGEESLETTLISIMKRKRQRDPKARRRGLVASTMARRMSDDEIDKALDDAYAGDTDYRSISASKKEENAEDEEEERRRKERHRRRREKRMKEKAQAPSDTIDNRDDVEEYQGETGPLDMPIESSRKRHEEETPMEQAPPEGQEDAELAQKMEGTTLDAEADTQPIEGKEDNDESDDDDDKKKKKKKKHKKKKKKHKKQKKRSDQSGSEKEDRGRETKRDSRSKSRSRSRSLSSLSLSSISSTFSDNFDFAGMDFDPSEEGAFDRALMEYQAIRGQYVPPFAGGFDPYFFRGRGNFRGFPRGRARGQMFPWPRGRGGFFPYFPGDPNFFPFPPGPEGEKAAAEAARGRGGRGLPVSRGPWRGRGLRGRGIPPGFHFNYTEDDDGGCVYVQDSSSSSSSASGKKKKKKKHKRRSYSSRSYSSSGSYSSRSRSRSRRHRRRRHRSSSHSSYSRSSRSYSRSSYSSRSRSSRSYSRSSRSYSSYSRSSSRSRSHSRNSKKDRSRSGSRRDENANTWDRDDGRASPSYRPFGGGEFRPPVRVAEEEEEVPWWAEFDKTYEVEKKKQEEEKKKQENEEKIKKEENEDDDEPPSQSVVSPGEIDVVRCMMNLVDKARSQQDEVIEASRDCINDIITQICAVPPQATQLHEESKDPFDKIIHDCVDSMLDRVSPNDPQTAARMCLKEIIDTVVEQEEEDKANEEATEMEKEITESKQSRLFQCYLQAQKLTEQIRAERKLKGIADDAEKLPSEKPKSDERKKDRRGHRSRHRRRSRSRSRDRRRRRRGRSSSDSRSRSSSRSSDRRMPLVSKESLQQAQAVLLMQQQQLQVAGLLGTGMPNLAGLNQAAALAAGIKPSLVPKTESQDPSGVAVDDRDFQAKFSKWDKDKDAMQKTKSKDDLTRKLMLRMKEKKLQQGEEGDLSPTFLARSKEKAGEATAEKVFTGPGSLKSRKIAISSHFGKLWSKVEGSPKQDEDSQDGMKFEAKQGYNKSDIVAAAIETKEQTANAEKLKQEEQDKKLAAWSDQQAKLKEEAKREMREQIERAERAKKEKMKEEILEQERQKEIVRIREEVRNQIRKEIQEEIEKQRKTVLEDPGVREKLLELEALRSQSGMISTDGLQTATSSGQNVPTSSAQPMPAQQPANMQAMRDARWYQQQLKNKQDMQKWMEGHGYYESDMDETQMKRMQLTYMQQWSQPQIQGYMQWYWQNQQQPPPGYYQQQQQHTMMQRQGTGPQAPMPQLMPANDMPERGHDPNIRGRNRPFMDHSSAQGPQHPEQHRQDNARPGNTGFQHGMDPNAMGQGRPQMHQGRGMPPHGGGPMGNRGYDQPPRQQLPQFRDERQMREFQQQREGLPPRDQYHWHREHPQGSQQQPMNQQNLQQQPNMQPPPNQGNQGHGFVEEAPLHQYPPPGIEVEDERSEESGAAGPGPVPEPDQQTTVIPKPQHVPGPNGQPPPPGESMDAAKMLAMRSQIRDELAPPGEELAPAGQSPVEEESSKSKKKKKQKKHRKHKKKKYSSSEEEETAAKDPEAEKAAILAQLQHLQDVEDGEIASGEEGGTQVAVVPPPEEQKESKKKKKHKKEKRRHRKKKDDSSDDEQPAQQQQPPPQQKPQQISAQHLPPPPVPAFYQGGPPFDPNRPNFPGMPPSEQQRAPGPQNIDYPPSSMAGSFGPPGQRGPRFPPGREGPPFMGDRERPGFMPHHRGSGEPQRIMGHPDPHQHPMGPSGDHNPQQRKRTPSPLPLVIPTDPHEYEAWQRKMEAKYGDGDTKGPENRPDNRPQDGARPEPQIDQQLMKDIEAIRRRQGDRNLDAANEDVMMMMRMMDEEQRRHRAEAGPGHEPPRRKRHGQMPRGGRKRSRRQLPRKNYHDWDKPEDDGLIYCMSDSGSSGWGSDSNMDFDRMLAKKRRETGQDKREGMPQQRSSPRPPMEVEMRRNQSPGHMMGWDRRDMPPRGDMPLHGGEKPQGIPVIGGGPRPIPTNVSSGRPTPPHRHPDMMAPSSQGILGVDFLPPDIMKLPPQFQPGGYPPDPMGQRRDPGLQPQMPPGGHAIPRLGGPPPSMPPMMMNPGMHEHMPLPGPPGRMHPMDYEKFRPRYGGM